MADKKILSLPTPRTQGWWDSVDLPRLNRVNIRYIWKRFRVGLLVWILSSIFLGMVQFSSPDLPDNDGYYHIKMAYLMRTEGFTPEFRWLPLSVLNPREFYDHHFLFHVMLIPFTFEDLRIGAKLAAVFFASLAFLSTWNLLKNQRIPYSVLWALGLAAVSEAFIYRMSITRAQSLSLAVLIIGLDWLLRKKHSRLVFLAFVYVWLYNAFPLLLVIAGIYVLAAWISDGKPDFRPLLYIGIGTALGLVINPYFPYNIVFAALHIMPKLFETTAISVGNEWYPYTTGQLLTNSLLALAALLSGAFALGLSGKRMDLRTTASFGIACVFGLMLFQSRRFIEYFPAFSLVFAAFAWTPVFNINSSQLQSRFQKHLPALVMVLILIPGIWMTFGAAKSSLQSAKPYQTYASASAWLAENTPAGSRVFQTDWDDFPRLFYYNTHNTYLAGLDPTYLLLYNKELYYQWVDISRGKVEQPAATIEGIFGSRYILTDLKHTNFLKQASRDPNIIERYRDEYAVIFEITGVRQSE